MSMNSYYGQQRDPEVVREAMKDRQEQIREEVEGIRLANQNRKPNVFKRLAAKLKK
jgi:hypothetical protein